MRTFVLNFNHTLARLLDILIAVYQLIPRPKSCRFYPSCSCYARQALGSHTLPTALVLIIKRLLSCHPLNPGGIDPVPPSIVNR